MMFNYHHFDEVFNFDPRCIYDEDAIHNIEANRKLLQGLFVDKVFKVLGIKRRTYTNVVQKYMLIHLVAVKHYPPKSDTDLRNLHKAVVESSGADHHKISVLYYILLDFDAPTGRRIHSTAFEENTFLPQKYQVYMKGLWHLDRLDLEVRQPLMLLNLRQKLTVLQVALQYLTYPSLIPTFPDEILEVLIRLAKNDDFTLPLAYYHTVQPALCSSQAIESLLSAIARTNVTEAFYFCRSQQEYTQRHMFEMLTSLVLNNSPNDTIASRSVELVNLPFTMEEEVWLEDYLLHGEGRTIRKSIDTLMMVCILGLLPIAGSFRSCARVLLNWDFLPY
jgi:hypothetical protein